MLLSTLTLLEVFTKNTENNQLLLGGKVTCNWSNYVWQLNRLGACYVAFFLFLILPIEHTRLFVWALHHWSGLQTFCMLWSKLVSLPSKRLSLVYIDCHYFHPFPPINVPISCHSSTSIYYCQCMHVRCFHCIYNHSLQESGVDIVSQVVFLLCSLRADIQRLCGAVLLNLATHKSHKYFKGVYLIPNS